MKKNLVDCKTSEEQRRYYPQLSKIADAMEKISDGDPGRMIAAIIYVLGTRQDERSKANKQ